MLLIQQARYLALSHINIQLWVGPAKNLSTSCQPCSLAAVIGQIVDPADICYDMRTDLDSDALSG